MERESKMKDRQSSPQSQIAGVDVQDIDTQPDSHEIAARPGHRIRELGKAKTVIQAVAFLGIFLLLLVAVSYMVRTNGAVKDRFSGFYAEKNHTLDIVMIGSSPVFPYYAAPKLWGETGIAMYPLSSNVQRPAAMKYLVEEAEKTQSPALYIFEMRMFTMEDAGLSDNMAYTRGVTDNMKYSWQRIRTIRALVPEEDEEGRLSYYLDIMKYHTNWKMLALPSEWANIAYHKASPLKGFEFKDVCSSDLRGGASAHAGLRQGSGRVCDSGRAGSLSERPVSIFAEVREGCAVYCVSLRGVLRGPADVQLYGRNRHVLWIWIPEYE